MGLKTYISKYPAQAFSWPGSKTVYFHNGEYSTDNKDIQEHIEGSDGWGKTVWEKPSPLAVAEAAVSDARAALKKAQGVLDAALAAAEALKPAAAPAAPSA